MRRIFGKTIAIALALAACGPDRNGPGNNPDGGGGGPDSGGGGGGDGPGGGGDGCSDEAKLVYVVDANRKMSQFNPPTKTFTDLGTLSCPTSASPFSMAIARDATAWVLYDNGDLFRVETKNNLACTKAAWVRSTDGLTKFGMGFSTDQVGGTTDTLFVSGGFGPSDSTSTLARVDLTSFQPTKVGTVTGWPELTGTGSAELWGFFPSTTNARVVQVDKTSGGVLRTYPLSTLNGDPRAWAFAFHGGSFWVFLKKGSEASTTVYQVNAATGAIVGSTPASGRSIVGAGVSTCAPIIL